MFFFPNLMIGEGIIQTQRVYIIPFNLVIPANWITFHSLRDEDEDVGQTELKMFFFQDLKSWSFEH